MVPTQGHVFAKRRDGPINARFPVTPPKGLGQHFLVEPLSPGHLGSQENCLLPPVSISNLIHNFFFGLLSQRTVASRTVLTAKLAI